MSKSENRRTDTWLVRHRVPVSFVSGLLIFLFALGLSIWLGILDAVVPMREMETAPWPAFVAVALVVVASAVGTWKLVR